MYFIRLLVAPIGAKIQTFFLFLFFIIQYVIGRNEAIS